MKLILLLISLFLITGCDQKISSEKGGTFIYKGYEWKGNTLLLKADFELKTYFKKRYINGVDKGRFWHLPSPRKAITFHCGPLKSKPSKVYGRYTLKENKKVIMEKFIEFDFSGIGGSPCKKFDLDVVKIGRIKNIKIDWPKS